jgi:hypothetical protein
MSKFELFLLSKGYKKYKEHKQELLSVDDNEYEISSMSNMCYVYLKDDKRITFGLCTHDRPPTIIGPRPSIESKRLRSDGSITIQSEILDDNVNYLIMNTDYEKILEAMFDKTICFNIDLTKE